MSGAGVELRARDLEVAYGDVVALRIPQIVLRGRVIAIIGHNGSGKSTLIKSLLQLLPPRRGELSLSWTHQSGNSEILTPEQHMAFSPENGAVFADISVRSYVELWCRIKHGDPSYYRRGGAEIIERLQLDPLLPRLGRELSKGQRRRVQIAVGFITRPRVFLFDEPFDGLDVQQASELSAIMSDAAKEMALFVSSHRMDVVERLADRVIVLKQGTILTAGPLEDVCEALCERSILVTLHETAHVRMHEIEELLRRHFPGCLVHHVGSQLVVSGTGVHEHELHALLQEREVGEVNFESVRPSLIDAMNYHLRHHALGSS